MIFTFCITQSPVVAFAVACRVSLTRNLDEALVQAQIMTDTVLPSLLVLLVIRKLLHYVTDDAKCLNNTILKLVI